MSLRYWVAYRRSGGDMAGAEVTVDHPLDGIVGRIEAERALAERGVPDPRITGWAQRNAPDQEKWSAQWPATTPAATATARAANRSVEPAPTAEGPAGTGATAISRRRAHPSADITNIQVDQQERSQT